MVPLMQPLASALENEPTEICYCDGGDKNGFHDKWLGILIETGGPA
jgi:hypothetical protein